QGVGVAQRRELVDLNKSGRCGSAAKQSPHRPGISRAPGLRAGSDGLFILSQTERPSLRKEPIMNTVPSSRRRGRPARPVRARLQVELLESRDVPSTFNL